MRGCVLKLDLICGIEDLGHDYIGGKSSRLIKFWKRRVMYASDENKIDDKGFR